MGLGADISRRDFLSGAAVAIGSSLLPWSDLHALDGGPKPYYPPTLTGMRGSHDGSFEVAHALRDGVDFGSDKDVDDLYDLVVVGGGISGLSAAFFYRKQYDPNARILILDNHDDFGGHAKRNEFWHNGRMYLMPGGTKYIEAPSQYSTIAAGLLWELGIDRTRFYEAQNNVEDLYEKMGLETGVFFDEDTFGNDHLSKGFYAKPAAEVFKNAPLSAKAKMDLVRLLEGGENYLPDLSPEQRREKLTKISYKDFLLDYAGCDPEIISLFELLPMGYFGVGAEATPAIYGFEDGYPGFGGMEIPPLPESVLVNEPGGQHGRENLKRAQSGDPDIYFPDGNATIARLLVRALIPAAVPGGSMEDIVSARIDYSSLDKKDSRIRMRLNSTVTNVRHTNSKEVAISYVHGGKSYRVRAKSSILACWHSAIPHICPELPAAQKDALSECVKVPMVVTSVLLSNWEAFAKARVSTVYAPGSYHMGVNLSKPMQIGDYATSKSPEEPILVEMYRFPRHPGLSKREQHRLGRTELLTTPFEVFERNIREQLMRIFSPYGFDDARDILAITVNRWPHGYAYTYNPLFDPVEWAYESTDDRPHVKARKPFGQITIANADAAASPHTDAAINEAYRAVVELRWK